MNALIGLEDKSQLVLSSSGLASRNRASNPAIQARHCSGVIRSGGTYLMLFSIGCVFRANVTIDSKRT